MTENFGFNDSNDLTCLLIHFHQKIVMLFIYTRTDQIQTGIVV